MQTPSNCLLHLETMNKYGIWTGGADDRKMDSVKATSIVGGMRFWADALLRAEGQRCCTDQGRCKPEKACPTCQIFGHTGLSRAFNVSVNTEKFSPCEKGTLKITLNDVPGGRKDHPSYYLTLGYTGNLELGLAMRRPHNDSYALPKEALTALYLMLEYGTLGAYDQYGCGLVRMKNDEEEKLRNLCADYQPASGPAARDALTFRDFFFFKGKITDLDKDRAMCHIRYDVRKSLHEISGVSTNIRHEFCGCIGSNAMSTDYALSISPDGTLYGWGHFSRTLGSEELRNKVVNVLYHTIHDYVTDFEWKEFNSEKRDKTSYNNYGDNWGEYLRSLINPKTPWRN